MSTPSPSIRLFRLGPDVRRMRKERGLTQLALAQLAGVPRRKVVEIEQGDPRVSIRSYAAVASALGAEMTLTPSRRPTLDEARSLFADDDA